MTKNFWLTIWKCTNLRRNLQSTYNFERSVQEGRRRWDATVVAALKLEVVSGSRPVIEVPSSAFTVETFARGEQFITSAKLIVLILQSRRRNVGVVIERVNDIKEMTQLAGSLQFLNGKNKIWDVVEGPASVEAAYESQGRRRLREQPRQGGKPLDCSKPGKSEATATAKTMRRAVDRVTWEETRAAIRLSAAKDSGESDRGDKDPQLFSKLKSCAYRVCRKTLTKKDIIGTNLFIKSEKTIESNAKYHEYVKLKTSIVMPAEITTIFHCRWHSDDSLDSINLLLIFACPNAVPKAGKFSGSRKNQCESTDNRRRINHNIEYQLDTKVHKAAVFSDKICINSTQRANRSYCIRILFDLEQNLIEAKRKGSGGACRKTNRILISMYSKLREILLRMHALQLKNLSSECYFLEKLLATMTRRPGVEVKLLSQISYDMENRAIDQFEDWYCINGYGLNNDVATKANGFPLASETRISQVLGGPTRGSFVSDLRFSLNMNFIVLSTFPVTKFERNDRSRSERWDSLTALETSQENYPINIGNSQVIEFLECDRFLVIEFLTEFSDPKNSRSDSKDTILSLYKARAARGEKERQRRSNESNRKKETGSPEPGRFTASNHVQETDRRGREKAGQEVKRDSSLCMDKAIGQMNRKRV
ncbi:hypothetical protein WN51_02156 [Melipona quadrifasciata]|uniref:Uncharacterized protein n=1 Tax=Melipona quadrifasciata TaxID=166423 RepID=A0A0N0U477_9HYME|nr:hypothetical protein WN51_02156 [Melipona quadrifasciata]